MVFFIFNNLKLKETKKNFFTRSKTILASFWGCNKKILIINFEFAFCRLFLELLEGIKEVFIFNFKVLNILKMKTLPRATKLAYFLELNSKTNMYLIGSNHSTLLCVIYITIILF